MGGWGGGEHVSRNPHQRREGILRHLSGTHHVPRMVFTARYALK